MPLPNCILLMLLPSLSALAADAWTASLPVVERAPRPRELPAYPEDGKPPGVNPPGFCWTPLERARSYRLELRRGARVVLSTPPLASTVYAHPKTLRPGAYSWQVVYLDDAGAPLGVSKTRAFTLRPGLPELPMPDVARLKTQLAKVHPRLFLAGPRLRQIQAAARSGQVGRWTAFLAAADRALEEKPYPEPAPYANGVFTADEWRRIYAPGKIGSAHLARTALAYKLTGEPKYLEGARRWMMNLAAWDPKGTTSHGLPLADGSEGNDEASMPMLERMAMGWDWIGDRLSPAERAKVLEVMTERGNQVLRLLHKQDFLSHPFSNHEGRVLAFLGLAGLSFLGDLPDAERWLDYVLRCYLTSYPAWGGDEGGWAQGASYWSSYLYWLTTFAEALRGVAGVDILQRPFYRHTGYFAVFMHPPYSPRGAFGDGGYHPPSETGRMLLEYFAQTFRDPVLSWQARSIQVAPESADALRWREWFMEDAASVWRATGSPVPPQPPAGLEGSRHFADIGWVAMHTALGDAREDVWALFKSSRFGSFSHSHADQNTFQLNAYGRALLIDSGYYPWYGSPHDVLWTRQTRAHNGILVNGRGQPPFDWAALGGIERYERHGAVTLVRGQAAGAYNRPQSAGTLKLWAQHLTEPVPPMEPRLETFERTLAFVGSKTRPVLVVYDLLRASAPTTFDYLLHALNKLEADSSSGVIRARDGEARLAVRLVASVPFAFSQHTGFPAPPEVAENTAYIEAEKERKARFPDQWHLSARTQEPAGEIKFLAVMVPYRASESEPEIALLESSSARGFRVGGVEVAAWWGAGERGPITLGRLTGSGRLVLKVPEQDRTIVSE